MKTPVIFRTLLLIVLECTSIFTCAHAEGKRLKGYLLTDLVNDVQDHLGLKYDENGLLQYVILTEQDDMESGCEILRPGNTKTNFHEYLSLPFNDDNGLLKTDYYDGYKFYYDEKNRLNRFDNKGGVKHIRYGYDRILSITDSVGTEAYKRIEFEYGTDTCKGFVPWLYFFLLNDGMVPVCAEYYVAFPHTIGLQTNYLPKMVKITRKDETEEKLFFDYTFYDDGYLKYVELDHHGIGTFSYYGSRSVLFYWE